MTLAQFPEFGFFHNFQLSFGLKLLTLTFSTINSVIFSPANKIERNLTVQSRKALSKSEDIRFVALELTLWLRKSSDSEKAFQNWTNVYRCFCYEHEYFIGQQLNGRV